MIKEKLRNLHSDKGVSQKQLASVISTDVSNYSRKENGERKITRQEWEKLAKFLEVPVDDIYEEDFPQQIINNYDNQGSYAGSNNYFRNIPDFILNNQQDYIEMLKKENQNLQKENQILQEKLKNLEDK